MNDYTNARYWAISGIGYGRGHTPEEAIENYVSVQARNWRNTIFKTKAKWEEALRTGDAKAIVWKAPEGATGFVLDSYVNWTFEGDDKRRFERATAGQRVVATTTGELTDLVNKACNDVMNELEPEFETEDTIRDQSRFDLLVNVIVHRLDNPQATVREAIEQCWDEDADTVLGWSA